MKSFRPSVQTSDILNITMFIPAVEVYEDGEFKMSIQLTETHASDEAWRQSDELFKQLEEMEKCQV